jgi:acyl-CoA reductase-like NAD-dependent aldehyde dehydrogenase
MLLWCFVGGPGMVKAAYESGHPSIGVGAGNTPAVIDASADIPMAVSSILISKTFDNGVICASEQNMVVEAAVSSSCSARAHSYCLMLSFIMGRAGICNVVLAEVLL